MAHNRMNRPARGVLFLVAMAAVIAGIIALPIARTAVAAGPPPYQPGPKLPEEMGSTPAEKAKTIVSIDRGLKYLAKTQRNDGSWLNQGGYGTYPAVMTSLAGLAFMSGGSTPETGPYARNVTKAMIYILRVAESHKDGLIAGPGAESRSMYGHGFSMLFLAHCYGMEIGEEYEKRLRVVLDRAVALTAKSQSDLGAGLKHAGGWIYTPTSNGDEGSVTVTQLQALRACRNVGIKVPKSTIERAVAYLKHCQMGDGGICYSARSRSSSRPAISAAAIACFYAAGIYDRRAGGAEGEESKMVAKLLAYVKNHVKPSSSSGGTWGHYFYTHLYMAEALYSRGGKDWKEYYPSIRKQMLDRQSPDGSWNGDGVGTTYGTAIATLILQLPYGYLPIVER